MDLDRRISREIYKPVKFPILGSYFSITEKIFWPPLKVLGIVAQMHMAQQTLGGGGKESNSSSTDTPEENHTDSHEYVEYLDVDRLKFIKALAATLDTVPEVERYIEAEQKRWNRDNVLRILEARKVALEEDLSSGPQAGERVFGYTSQCASS